VNRITVFMSVSLGIRDPHRFSHNGK
jgi:hypothetical protein